MDAVFPRFSLFPGNVYPQASLALNGIESPEDRFVFIIFAIRAGFHMELNCNFKILFSFK